MVFIRSICVGNERIQCRGPHKIYITHIIRSYNVLFYFLCHRLLMNIVLSMIFKIIKKSTITFIFIFFCQYLSFINYTSLFINTILFPFFAYRCCEYELVVSTEGGGGMYFLRVQLSSTALDDHRHGTIVSILKRFTLNTLGGG